MTGNKTNLSSLRFILVFFFAGIGCLVPFLSLHVRATGFTLHDSWLILVGPPLVAAIGSVVCGCLVDHCSSTRRNANNEGTQNTCVRTLLSFTLLSAAILYSVLLIIPTYHIHPRQPEVTFVCDGGGAVLIVDKCDHCFRSAEPETRTIKINDCEYDCSFLSSGIEQFKITPPTTTTTTAITTTTHYSTTTTTNSNSKHSATTTEHSIFGPIDDEDEQDDDEELGSGEQDDVEYEMVVHRRTLKSVEERSSNVTTEQRPPHICNSGHSRLCTVYTSYSDPVTLNASLHQQLVHQDSCTYSVDGYYCRIPQDIEKHTQSCKVVCKTQHTFSDDSSPDNSLCKQVSGDPSFTHWLYFIVRCCADLFAAMSGCLLLGAALIAAQHKIGRELLFPSLVYGTCAVLVGYLHSNTDTPLQLEKMPNYFLAVVSCTLLFVLAIFVLIFSTELPIGPPDWWYKTNTTPTHKLETFGVLIVLLVLGMLWGPTVFQVPWYFGHIPRVEMLLGCAAGLGALIAAPLLWKSDIIVEYCGYSNILITAFVFYVFRYTGFYLMTSPWILVITGALDIFTFYLVLVTGALYIRHLVPRQSTFTAMSLVVAAHFCAGNGLGNLISGYISSDAIDHDYAKQPQLVAYVIYASCATAAAILYFFIYHCCLKAKCLAPAYRKDEPDVSAQGNGNNGIGSYTPLRVYHNGRQPTTNESD